MLLLDTARSCAGPGDPPYTVPHLACTTTVIYRDEQRRGALLQDAAISYVSVVSSCCSGACLLQDLFVVLGIAVPSWMWLEVELQLRS